MKAILLNIGPIYFAICFLCLFTVSLEEDKVDKREKD